MMWTCVSPRLVGSTLRNAGQKRLTAFFPFQYTYLAKSPGNLIRLSNRKTRVGEGMTAGRVGFFSLFSNVQYLTTGVRTPPLDALFP